MSAVERSLVFVKPEAACRPPVAARVLQRLATDPALEILSFEKIRVTEELARAHYAEHAEKPFFGILLAQVLATPVLVLVVEGPDAIQHVRDLAGATFVEDAEEGTLRRDFGLCTGLNVIHASDSLSSAAREIALWEAHGAVKIAPEEARARVDAYVDEWIGTEEKTERLCEILGDILQLKQDLYNFLKARPLDPAVTDEDLNRLVRAIFMYVGE